MSLVAKQMKIGSSAIVKARELQSRIDTLNSATIETLQEDLVVALETIATLEKKLNSIASLMSVEFNEDATISSESYTQLRKQVRRKHYE